MQKEVYLGYIAHFVENVDQTTSDSDYRSFFIEKLGSANVLAAPEIKVRDLSRNMYRAYVASMYIRYSPYYLLATLSSKQLSELLGTISETIDVYGLYKSIDDDISISNTDRHIKRDALYTYKSVLAKYSAQAASKKPTAAASKKLPVKKSNVASKKLAAKKPLSATKKTKPSAPAKSCTDYKLPELKEMAKAKKLAGYSKMNKATLCSSLKIK